MAVSLESRIPMLDHEVVEFAARVPDDFKFRYGQGKWILQQVLHRYIPRSLFERPKMGFGVPIEEWLRGSLREWADDLLSPSRIRDQGLLDDVVVTKMWREHQTGVRRWHYHLWDVLMFQSWFESQRDIRA
jgi:asparagine synthase (glutamine-hydrolysing)